ncbi:MAG TPA: fibronectin type III-like domain-contianing protein, partial [Acidimicrobiia bacterium]
ETTVAGGQAGWNDTVTITTRVSNVGSRDGDEVVQLYVRDPEASVTRPVLELKAFKRVEVPAGESALLRFGLPIGQIGFYNRDLDYVVEPGRVDLLIGTSSSDLVEIGFITVVPDPSGEPPRKVFDGRVEVEMT